MLASKSYKLIKYTIDKACTLKFIVNSVMVLNKSNLYRNFLIYYFFFTIASSRRYL